MGGGRRGVVEISSNDTESHKGGVTASTALAHRAAFVAVMVVAAAARLVCLDSVPPGMNQDEAVHAWDSWCLLKTGMDHGGSRWPEFCESFGPRESHAAPFVYLLIPFQALLGMNVWSTRLPAALSGTLAVALAYVFVARLANRRTALVAALLLAISPWHVHLSRLALEVSIAPTLLLAGLVLISLGAVRSQSTAPSRLRWGFVLSGGLVLGMASWTYNAYRVFVPAFLVATVVISWSRISTVWTSRDRFRAGAIAATGFIVGAAPFLVACFSTPEKAWGRAKSEFIFSKAASVADGIAEMVRTYGHQLSPSFLFTTGDPSLVQSVPGHGQLYVIVGVLMVAGLYVAIRQWNSFSLGRVVVVWILLAPIPASMTSLSSGHALRAATVIPAYEILAAIGLTWMLDRSLSWSAGGRIAIRSLLAIALIASASRFGYMFFAEYPVKAGPSFWEEYRPLFADVAARQKDYDVVLLSPSECPQNGTLYLFYKAADPQTFFKTPKRYWHGKDWDSLVQYGNVYFAYYRNLPVIVREGYSDRTELRILVAERPDVAVQGELLNKYYYSDGREAMRLYDVRVTLDRS